MSDGLPLVGIYVRRKTMSGANKSLDPIVLQKRIAELEAALANARRDAMEEAAKKALIIASVLSNPSAQNALRSFAEAIRAELEGEKE